MTDPIRRALLSVSDKSGLVDLARALADAGVELLSTGGTAKALRDAGLTVRDVSDYTGSPEVMDGRVKTLHPRVHGGILARRGTVHMADLERIGGAPIDLVCVNLYPFAAATAKAGCTVAEAIENIDIGGPSMVRSAAKNFRDVVILTCPGQYAGFLKEWTETSAVSPATRLDLARAAFLHTHAYDGMVAEVLARDLDVQGDAGLLPARPAVPAVLPLPLVKHLPLRYGENPHQAAAWYLSAGDAPAWQLLQGKELSYNNLLDLEAARRIAADLPANGVSIIKHTNPCGAARGATAAAALKRALETDPVSAFGGIVGVNGAVDEAFVDALGDLFLECLVAPAITDGARARFAARKNLRVVVLPDMKREAAPGVAPALGGWLGQEPDRGTGLGARKVVTQRAPSDAEWQALDMAWVLAKHVKSNAIVFADAEGTLAVGAGQMSRVDSARIAVSKARVALKGSAVGSDAFFPFPDGLEVVAEAGATAVAQPGGSKRDADVIAAADRLGVAMVFTGERHFRH